ncbi:MAG: hypothetical protein U0324_30915 [Polyangiales bacterium]
MRRWMSVFPLVAALSCDGGASVDTLAPAASRVGRPSRGPKVKWDLGHRPLPEIPLPNDVATFPDPTSPTGLRINASVVTPTAFESRQREGFDELDGWGTYQPITVPFEEDLDLAELTRRMRGDDHDFADDAVYLVNLRTGVPVPLDVGDGAFQYTARNRDGYYPNDPRGGQSNLIFETVNEDVNLNGVMDPGEDTNFDGVLNRAALFPANANPNDALSPYWEPDTRTLIVRPLVPLEERTRYAVVLTDRLRGLNGDPVRSPFPGVAHPAQASALDALDAHLRGPHAAYYGGLVYRPGAADGTNARVTFAWAFTTQTTVSDLLEVRRGLYNEGPFARSLAPITPDLRLLRANDGNDCSTDQEARPYIIRGAALTRLVDALGQALGVDEWGRGLLRDQYRYVDYIAVGTYRVPYPMGDPRSGDHHARWRLNTRTGAIDHLGTDTVQFALVVPKAIGERRAPFPVAFMGHGYTGNLTDALGFGPFMAAQGIAMMGINAPGHGLVLGSSERTLIPLLLRGMCNGGLTAGLVESRARDLNGDDIPDSGGDFWTGYVFHTRDQVRQHALDHMQLIRALRGFDGRARAGVDLNANGRTDDDLAGDFNGDGTPDIGGPDAAFFTMGGSLGGIMSMVLGAADASVRAAAPVSGGGGLADVGLRSTQGGVKEAVILRVMGPLVLSLPASNYPAQGSTRRTSCRDGQMSLRFVVPDLNDTGELEFACADVSAPGAEAPAAGNAIAPGDDVRIDNLRTGERRCARATADARFRLGIPTDVDDPLELTVYRGGVIRDYGTCEAAEGAPIRSSVRTMQVVEGDCERHCGHIPPDATAASTGVRRWSTRGAPLRSPAEGLGLARQTPGLRRFLFLSQAALDAADPITWAPLYYLRRPADHRPHAVLVINTAGDQAVPVSTGNAFARAAGIVPFLAPGTDARYPEWADFVTPNDLWQRYRRSPDRVLADRGVLEGLSSLGRFPSSMRPDALFDVDDLDEGRQGFGEQALMPPLRLVRRAERATPGGGVDAAWQPTLAAWSGDTGPSVALLNAYIVPEGTHSFALPRMRDAWKPQLYLLTTAARFFATVGADLYYRSHPNDHQCAERMDCAFLPPRPASQ